MDRATRKPVVVAAGQLQSRLMNEAEATLQAIAAMIDQAAAQQVDLLVLPECAYPAYLLGSAESYRTGGHLTSGQFLEWLSAQAARHRLHIASGYVEDTDGRLFNSAILLGPDGRTIGQARKRFLWHADHDWFTPGDEIRAFDTDLGRIGIIICAEARVPEIIATLIADGAELMVMPTCWINSSRQPGEYYNPQPDYLIAARAREFGVPFVCADKSGLELTTGYVGQSCIAVADCSVPVMAPSTGEALVVSTIQLRRPPALQIDDSHRARLLDAAPANPRARRSSRRATIAAVSTSLADRYLTGGQGEGLLRPLQQQGVEILVADLPDPVRADQLAGYARKFDIHTLASPDRTGVFDLGPARAGSVADGGPGSFASGRSLSLQGAEVLVYFRAAGDEQMLRTRAMENRVFVIGADRETSIIVGPNGEVLARGTSAEAAVVSVDLAEASNKLVAPKTDIFAERKPGMYRF
jgi:predicted amidohydrolase